MKIIAENFKNLDRKWVKIADKTSIEKLQYGMRRKLDGDFYLGHVYIDHFLGLSMILIGGAKETNVGIMPVYDIKKLEENIAEIHVDYLEIANLDAKTIDKKEVNKTLAYIIESYVNENVYLPFLENQKYIFESRQDEALDKFREPYFPDVIKFTLAKKDIIPEEIYGRIEDIDDKSNDIIVTVLNNPIDKQYNLNKGDLAFINYIENDICKGYVCLKTMTYAEGKLKYKYVVDPREDFEIDHIELIKYAKANNKKLTDLTAEEIQKFKKEK